MNETKGQKDGECARKVCHRSPATHYNCSTREWYCISCARIINMHNGIELCKPFVHNFPISDDEAEQLKSRAAILLMGKDQNS